MKLPIGKNEYRMNIRFWYGVRGYLVRTAVGLLSAVLFTGCSRETHKDVPMSTQHLRAIGVAYLRASAAYNRPPRNLEELKAHLKDSANVDELLRSPNDGEAYVIHYNVNLSVPVMPGQTPPVLAYEKVGKDGKRNVLLGRESHVLTEDEFRKATFPAGSTPPP